MDSTKNEECQSAFSDKDAASATGPAPEGVTDVPVEMTEGTPANSATRRSEQPESSNAEQESSHAQEELDHCGTASPGHQSQDELHQGGENESFRAEDPDLRQFYPMPGSRLPNFGQDYHYDDLPLVFSMPSSDEDSSKVFSCHLCNFKTAFKNSLVNHQAVHSDVRPWICEICDYAAKRKQDLKKHLQTMHGMIVDSLALRPGVNPPPSSVSSSGLASPVETKPVVANSVVPSEQQSNFGHVSFPATPYARSSASLLPHQLRSAGSGQQLPSTAKLNPMTRSLAMPAVGKFIGDKFPFNQFYGEGSASKAAPHSSSEMFLQRMQSALREESDSDNTDNTSGMGNFFFEKSWAPKQEVSRDSCSQKTARDVGHAECKEDSHLQPVKESLQTDRKRRRSVSDQHSTTGGERGHSSLTNSEDLADMPPSVSYHSEETGSARRWKRTSVDSPSDRASTKVARFQSPVWDPDRSPQVTSQSDHSGTGNGDLITSTVSHSRALETRKSFHCVHCDILFFENALYLMHMGLHDNSNPWKCSICGRTFFEKYSFTSHFINQH